MLNRLVLLAHPDDEMLCLPFLVAEGAEEFQRDFFLYLTLNSLSESRISESKEAIRLLNREVRKSELVEFDFSLRDGAAWKDFTIYDLKSLFRLVQELKIDVILTFTYEGGHQDHDLANVVSKAIKNRFDLKITEFSGYRKHNRLPIFVVCNPTSRTDKIIFSRSKGLRLFFKLAMIHKSQFRVWCLLAPPILGKLLMGSVFAAQTTPFSSRPISVKYLYELRNKASRESVESSLLKLL